MLDPNQGGVKIYYLTKTLKLNYKPCHMDYSI